MKILPIVLIMIFLAGTLPAQTTTGRTAASGTSPRLKTRQDTISYLIGTEYGAYLSLVKDSVNADLFIRGIQDKLKGTLQKMDPVQTIPMMTEFQQKHRILEQQKIDADIIKNRKDGQAFMDVNKLKKDIHTTASGLQYQVIREGTGPKPLLTSKVLVNYRGTSLDGKEFAGTYLDKKPKEMMVNGMIIGWQEGLQLMTVGSKYRFFVPPTLAYGSKNVLEGIGAEATLIFEIELLQILN
jgi:FKBP-type peptidyl-prolyl cis-trans isomerase FkpA